MTVRRLIILSIAFAAACGGSSSPTAPTPPSAFTPPPVAVAPPLTPPTVTPPADDGLTRDPRFSLGFYRSFALDGGKQPLNRLAQAPSIYLFTSDRSGRAIDARQLDSTAAALVNVASAWSGGKFGLEGIERGSGAADQRSNRIFVSWSDDAGANACAATNGRTITLYYRVQVCLCNGVMRPRTVKHELGHAMGFYHTFDAQDLMSGLSDNRCDQDPSERERFHALVAYSRPIGSLDP